MPIQETLNNPYKASKANGHKWPNYLLHFTVWGLDASGGCLLGGAGGEDAAGTMDWTGVLTLTDPIVLTVNHVWRLFYDQHANFASVLLFSISLLQETTEPNIDINKYT